MNEEQIARLRAVRDSIATQPESMFSMATVAARSDENPAYAVHRGETIEELIDSVRLKEGDNPCGTVCCLAGRTCAIFAPGTLIDEAIPKAGDLLGLSYPEESRLFLGDIWRSQIAVITKDQVLDVLDRFIATGEISWQKAGVSAEVVNDADFTESGEYVEGSSDPDYDPDY